MEEYRRHIIALLDRRDISDRQLLEMISEYTETELDFLETGETERKSLHSLLFSLGIRYLTVELNKFHIDSFGPEGIADIYSVRIDTSSSEFKVWNSTYMNKDNYGTDITLDKEQTDLLIKFMKSIKNWTYVTEKLKIYLIPDTNCVCILNRNTSSYGEATGYITNRMRRYRYQGKEQSLLVWRGFRRDTETISIPLMIDSLGFASEDPIVKTMMKHMNE